MAQTGGQRKIQWDGSRAQTTAASTCDVVGTREEVALLFAESEPGRGANEGGVLAKGRRILLSPSTAKRLAVALAGVLQSPGAESGPADSPSHERAGSGPMGAPGEPSGDQDRGHAKGRLLSQLADTLDLEGQERSFRMVRNRLLTNRFLLGVSKENLDPQDLEAILNELEMPDAHVHAFREHLPDANLILFGFEENETRCVCKVYLEFWEKIISEISADPDKVEPALLHLGFKWDAADNTRATIARYTCYPLLDRQQVLGRLPGVFQDAEDSAAQEIAGDIVRYAYEKTSDDTFVYLEVSEEGNPRRSYDINLYKAGLRVGDLGPFLFRLRSHYLIPEEPFRSLCDQIHGRPLGHLAGGVDREGKSFATIYYES